MPEAQQRRQYLLAVDLRCNASEQCPLPPDGDSLALRELCYALLDADSGALVSQKGLPVSPGTPLGGVLDPVADLFAEHPCTVIVTNGRWPLLSVLRRLAAAASVELAAHWLRFHDVRREVARFARCPTPPSMGGCLAQLGLSGAPEQGAATCRSMAAALGVLVRGRHVFRRPATWVQAEGSDQDSAEGPPPQAAPNAAAAAAAAGDACVRMRGLPWTCTEPEIAAFFKGYALTQVLFSFDGLGRPKGECFACFATPDEAARAVAGRDRQELGGRYVELFLSSPQELREACASQAADTSGSLLLRLRGLPFSATEEEVGQLMSRAAVRLVRGSIHVQIGPDGRPVGQAFVRVADEEAAQKALALHTVARMGHRYVEVYRAGEAELQSVVQQAALLNSAAAQPLAGTAGSEHIVKLRGLPFSATQVDIAAFFAGLIPAPRGIHLVLGPDKRPTGDAYVEFRSAGDAQAAAAKDRQQLGHRYVEVRRSSRVEMQAAGAAAEGPEVPANVGGALRSTLGAALVAAPQPAGPGGPRPGDWPCPGCGFLCFASRATCMHCGAARAGGALRA
eukprot:TRINITY_DN56118_c0_g1_i1.p1 TRINITY_DN56118_c0_g1~~TRINITY_DN56118_c0_g1_i1.p1  ORF type:complete len:566 (+),score=159.32 TRINITY_DN56118_c0_g1_i1:72-1769(+)